MELVIKIIGSISEDIKRKLGIKTDINNIIMSDGFIKHLEKRNHQNMYKYLDNVSDIIKNPDYIGVNPREKSASLEYVKLYEDNVLLGIKIDIKKDYFYIAIMHEISNLKLSQRIKNKRLIKFDKK
ncbi:hypothetical protein HZY83_02500 [Gemella sp. GH3]|uniref:PBECR3 domain-containing polyvalent protein n=1 Tax=unclassified Gemella TaxID=2624949 RepID=UPI0015CFAB80|nr:MULTISPECIES: PBECR2 nuclease fold domain-containing protein [unclassified Gemella]MBF0713557.1 hypothetical protein [Gemella sp. GH3.1]NYS50509.1 hypothetical protein [Gemella sp. GH3]